MSRCAHRIVLPMIACALLALAPCFASAQSPLINPLSAQADWPAPQSDPSLRPPVSPSEVWDYGVDPLQYPTCYDDCWTWIAFPEGLLYKSYMAGTREPRTSGAWLYESDRGWVWDIALGGRMGLLRYGTPGGVCGEGWEVDIEGAAFPRLDLDERSDLESADFRFGVPITWRSGPFQAKLAYYHLSSHVGDEYLERNPDFERINYSRDVIVLGGGYFPNPDLRLYAEAGWAFRTSGGSAPWEFQFGAEYSPICLPVWPGSPFWAVNVHLREEVDYGGSINTEAGWQWKHPITGRLLRIGLQYYNGKTNQFSFFNESEELVGFGIWYDF